MLPGGKHLLIRAVVFLLPIDEQQLVPLNALSKHDRVYGACRPATAVTCARIISIKSVVKICKGKY